MKYLLGLIAILFASVASAATVTVTADAPAVTTSGTGVFATKTWRIKLHVGVADSQSIGSLAAHYVRAGKDTACATAITDTPEGTTDLTCGIVQAPAKPGPFSSGARSGDTIQLYAVFNTADRAGSGATKSNNVSVTLP